MSASTNRALITALIIAIVVVIIIVAALLIRRSAVTPASPVGPDAVSPAELPDNLAVSILYRQGSSFNLTVQSVETTKAKPTLLHYQPLEGQAYSIVKLVDDQGNILIEEQFAVATEAIGETFTEDGGIPETAQIPFDETTSYLVISVPNINQVAKVILETPAGQVLDEYNISL